MQNIQNQNTEIKPQVETLRATVCFPVKQAQSANDSSWIHLAVKGSNIGQGFQNGYGGIIKEYETPRQCATRKIFEESDGVIVDPKLLRYVALGEFITNNDDGTRTIFKVHFFLAEQWIGEFRNTPKMFDGKWYRIDQLPLDKLMPDNRYWLEEVLKNNLNFERTWNCYLIEAIYGPHHELLQNSVLLTALNHKMTTG